MKLRNILFGNYREKILSNVICQEIQKLNEKIQRDNRVENILLPIRDGLMICKVL